MTKRRGGAFLLPWWEKVSSSSLVTAKDEIRRRIPGVSTPAPLPRPPSPGDAIDSTCLGLRLAALGRALDNLPREARRFARWRARRAENLPPPSLPSMKRVPREARRVGCAAARRIAPLRLDRPPGQSRANSRQPAHDIHEVLADLHYFAREALAQPDTS